MGVIVEPTQGELGMSAQGSRAVFCQLWEALGGLGAGDGQGILSLKLKRTSQILYPALSIQ